jgi:hypothetical protein
MTKEEIIEFENKLSQEYYQKLKEVRTAFLKNSEIQVGDFVKVFWESRDYGKESKELAVRFLGSRINDDRSWMYYFNRINKTGIESKRPFFLPKHSKIYKIVPMVK